MLVLGIETSCDETAAAIVSSDRRIVSNVVRSQVEEHVAYGGVVPEIASRAHIAHLEGVIARALDDAGMRLTEVDAIAATAGPGLIGGVIVGVMTAKAMALAAGKPFVAVNHLEGHALTARLTDDVAFPYLLLLVSGGHCQFLHVRGVGDYRKLGGTMDDALGEAFDKTAKLLEMGFPGGPAVEKLAVAGNAEAHRFTMPLAGREGCDFSFSGLKTSVRMAAGKLKDADALDMQAKADICASFQKVAADSVVERTRNALVMQPAETLVVAGGVAANQYLRARLEVVVAEYGIRLVCPPPKLCTDNAAMIAWAGIERLNAGFKDGLDFEPRARWPLDTAI